VKTYSAELLGALSKQGFLIIDGIPYTQCFYCGKNIELDLNDFDDPDGELFAECKDCSFHIDYHAKDPWYFKKHS
jgi:hypothetical protein